MSPTASTPQQRGREFEIEFAHMFGGEPVPGSGSTPRFKLDVDQITILWSLKHTDDESIRLKAEDFREALAGAEGPGSRSVIPAMALRIGGLDEVVGVVRIRDLLAFVRGEVKIEVDPTARDAMRARADPLAQFEDEE